MIDLRSAIDFIEKAAQENGTTLFPSPVHLPIGESLEETLAQDLLASIDHPPFNRSLRDGVAIRFHKESASDEYQLVGKVLAGQNPQFRLDSGQASIVMTGAPVPEGTDAVVMVEQVRWIGGESVSSSNQNSLWEGSQSATKIKIVSSSSDCCGESFDRNEFDDRYILKAGSLFKKGSSLLESGTSLTPRAIGLIASANTGQIECFSKPKVAILVTGDEVLPIGSSPKAGSIFNSNGPQLEHLSRQLGCDVISCGQVGDDRSDIQNWLKENLGKADIIITTGGVSVGTMDLMPSAFQATGITKVFHGVRMKPGKPVWFGAASLEEKTTFVFGLPGNPVGAFVGFQLFIRRLVESAKEKIVGGDPMKTSSSSCLKPWNRHWRRIKLKDDWAVGKGGRPIIWPGIVRWSIAESSFDPFLDSDDRQEESLEILPADWKGSPDLLSVAKSNCLLFADPTSRHFPSDGILPAGTALPCFLL